MSFKNFPQSFSSDIDQDQTVMLIATPKRLEQFGIDLGAHWRRDDHVPAAVGAHAVYFWNGDTQPVPREVDVGFLSANELARRMQVTVQAVYQKENAHEFFAVVPPARKRGRKYPAFLLDPKLDRIRIKELIELFNRHLDTGVTMNDLLNFLSAVRNELDGRTAIDSLLSRVTAKEREMVLNLAKEEIYQISQ